MLFKRLLQDVTDTIYKGFNIGDAGVGDDMNEQDLVEELNILLREEGEEEIERKLENLRAPKHHPFLSHENRPLSHILTEDTQIGGDQDEDEAEDGDVEIRAGQPSAEYTRRQPTPGPRREMDGGVAGVGGLVMRHPQAAAVGE